MKTIDIKLIKELLPENSIDMGEDILISHIEPSDESIGNLSEPFVFDGYLAIFLYSGEVNLSIDTKELQLKPQSLSITQPGNILCVLPKKEGDAVKEGIKFLIVAISKQWIYRSNINVSKLFSYGISIRQLPSITLNDKEMTIISRYRDIICDVYDSKRMFMNENMNFICSSLLCEVASFWEDRIQKGRQGDREIGRYIKLFSHFIYLAVKFHVQERSVTFYSSKMMVTSQHLSRVVKQVSGKTPMEHIDNLIIMEAKNMLLFTDMSMKEIAARLNFSNQTVFYRLFKRYTGMLPSKFRKQNVVSDL